MAEFTVPKWNILTGGKSVGIITYFFKNTVVFLCQIRSKPLVPSDLVLPELAVGWEDMIVNHSSWSQAVCLKLCDLKHITEPLCTLLFSFKISKPTSKGN